MTELNSISLGDNKIPAKVTAKDSYLIKPTKSFLSSGMKTCPIDFAEIKRRYIQFKVTYIAFPSWTQNKMGNVECYLTRNIDVQG